MPVGADYIEGMTRLTLVSAAALIALSPSARAEEDDWTEFRRMLEQFSEESQAFLKEWIEEISPMMESLREKVDDLSNYEAPEVLPNGDIIIRRKPDVPPDDTPQDAPPAEGQIDL
jgi:hypothetical protein